MIAFLLLIFVAFSNCIHYTPLLGNETSIESFFGYAKFFNKNYTSTSKIGAYKNYVEAVKIIAALSAMPETKNTVYGLTQFSDMSATEFKQKILMNTLHENYIAPKPMNLTVFGQSIDWRSRGMLTAVKNQHQCGSCWTFSATETIESANIIAGKLSSSNPLAPQQLVDCDNGGSGCSGGWPVQAMEWAQENGGLDTEASYPYRGTRGSCRRGRIGATITGVHQVGQYESSVYSALLSRPLSVCVDASAWQHYSGGVLSSSRCGRGIDHAVQLTGYSPYSGGYWIVRNSWGSGWGESGFIYLQYGADTCGITSYVSYATA